MAIIYKVQLEYKSLVNFESIINSEFTHEKFNVKHKSAWDRVDLEELKSKAKGFDTVHIREKVVMEPHTHDDDEQRLILSGVGHFFIPDAEHLYVIKATEGDFVSLNKDVIHWFTCKKGLVAARFFENEKSYKVIMKDIPHRIYRLKDDFEDLRNIQI